MQEVAFRQHKDAHKGGCNSVAFAPSGVHAASCGQDGKVRLWTAYDGALATELNSGAGASAAGMNCVAFCEERTLLLSASSDKSIKAWDIHTGRLKFAMTGTCSCSLRRYHVVKNNNNKKGCWRSIAQDRCGKLRYRLLLHKSGLVSTYSGRNEAFAGHTAAVTACAQHPTSPSVAASCGQDRMLRLWSVPDGICRRSIAVASMPLWVAFTRDGNLIVSAHQNGSLIAHDASSGAEVHKLEKMHSNACVGVAATNEAFKMVSVGKDDALCVTDMYNAKVCCKQFLKPQEMPAPAATHAQCLPESPNSQSCGMAGEC